MTVSNESKFHHTLLPLGSVHVCAVLPSCQWILWRFAWNNGKLLTQASLLNGECRLDHCDVIASSACRAKLTRQTKLHLRQIIGTKHKPCVTYGLKALISNPAGWFMSLIECHPCDYSFSNTGCVIMLNTFSCVAKFSVETSRIREFRIITGITTGLLGRCLWSTLGLRVNDYVKP